MENKQLPIKAQPGLNFTIDPVDGCIVVGCHVDTYQRYFGARADHKGWVNYKIKPLEVHTDKGYTHKFEIVKKDKAAEKAA